MPPQSDPRWKLVERVAASASFQRSKRVRDFLLFICERALDDPNAPIREPDIRKSVFGRSADPEDPEDTLVRVQASQLRKRLQVYFSTEGADEPLLVEVPKGSYTPLFRERPVERPGPAHPGPDVPAPPPPPRWRGRVSAATAAVLAVLCIVLLIQNRRLRATMPETPLSLSPSVDRLWRQMFGDARVYVVLSDSNATMFQDLIKYQLTLPEYQRQHFTALIEERLTDPAARVWATQLMNREFTSVADLHVARRLVTINTLQGRPSDVVVARHVDATRFESHNVVLAGPRRANPWLELYESKLNFRSRFTEGDRRAYLDNTAPQAGESATYQVVWNHAGYCRVAYLPNAAETHGVLILSGTDMSSSDAGSEFITSEHWVKPLLDDLGAKPGERIPYFEALLRAQLILGGSAPNFERISLRKMAVGSEQRQ
jgi:hypothetical protein